MYFKYKIKLKQQPILITTLSVIFTATVAKLFMFINQLFIMLINQLFIKCIYNHFLSVCNIFVYNLSKVE